MVTKLAPLCKVKLLKNGRDKLVVRSPEKAGVGGSTPSLATMFSITCVRPQPHLCSILFQKIKRDVPGFASIPVNNHRSEAAAVLPKPARVPKASPYD
jgi:hypothetical protein